MLRKYQAGFTLIEMLVVMSIISTLSSVVLSAVNNARIKSDETTKSKVLNEYINTLYLIYDKTGNYPPHNWLSDACLGSYSDGKCGLNNTVFVDSYFSTFFSDFLPALQTFKPVTGVLGTYEGPTYTCSAVDASNNCISVFITYWVPAAENCSATSLSTSPGVVYSWEPAVRLCSFNVVLQK